MTIANKMRIVFGAVMVWPRRLWPYLVILLLFGAAGAGISYYAGLVGAERALEQAHARTAVATVAAARADTVFRTDTVERRQTVVRYQAVRDTALIDLTDTAATKRAFAAADVAIARSDSSIEKAARAIQAHIVLESALRTELAAAMRLRTPRFQASSVAGLDVDARIPITGIEAEVRLTRQWSIVGRVEKRWTPGETTRRLLLVRRTF